MTVNCLEFRRALGADPNHASAESLAHRAECPTCERYAQEMLRLNGLIKRALEVPVPAQQPIKTPRLQPRWFAIAASALLTVGVVIGILSLGTPRDSLAAAVVAHLAHEPDAMTPTQVRVSNELLDGALRAKGLRLAHPMNNVSYLESCEIRGHLVPHLVVQTERGPVTVILLTEEKVKRTSRFDERQYHGMLVPMPRGAMAVIATDASVVDAVAENVKAAVSE
jgi:hypothetical protein